jgi:hypothetical protein
VEHPYTHIHLCYIPNTESTSRSSVLRSTCRKQQHLYHETLPVSCPCLRRHTASQFVECLGCPFCCYWFLLASYKSVFPKTNCMIVQDQLQTHKMETTKYILYNNCVGGFTFSHKFRDELAKRLGKTHIDYDERYRSNQIACQLVIERGSAWSSSPCSYIQVCMFPEFMEPWIEILEFEELETVCLKTANCIADKTRETLKNPTPEAIEELKAFIVRVDAACVTHVDTKLVNTN